MFIHPFLNILYIAAILVIAYRLLFGGNYFDGPGGGSLA